MFQEIDWSRAWYASVRDAASRIDLSLPSVVQPFCEQAAALALVNHAGQPLRFVPQASLPEGTAYEEFIGATGQVPTRDNLHDFFTGLVWLTFPRIKRQLNALQAAQIAQDGVGKSRGPARESERAGPRRRRGSSRNGGPPSAGVRDQGRPDGGRTGAAGGARRAIILK